VTLEGLPYREGIRVGLIHYLEVLQHVLMSVQSSCSQPLHEVSVMEVGFEEKEIVEGESLP
jgi:hypothetical protein